MDQAWDGARGPRPSTASIQVWELSSQGLHNPQPRSKAPGRRGHGHSEQLAEECLSPARLVSAGLGLAGCQMPCFPQGPTPGAWGRRSPSAFRPEGPKPGPSTDLLCMGLQGP